MAFEHGKGSAVLVAEHDISQYFSNSDIVSAVEGHEVPAYGDNSVPRHPGIGDGKAQFTGWYDAAVEDILAPLIGAAAGSPVTFCIGAKAFGDNTRSMLGLEGSLKTSAPVGGMVTLKADFEADGGMDAGKILQALASITASFDGASIDNGASSPEGGAAYIHCTAASGTSPTLDVKVQHSTNDSTWVDLATFTQLTDVGSEQVVVAAGTTVERYVRVQATLGGTSPDFTFLVAFARRHRPL